MKCIRVQQFNIVTVSCRNMKDIDHKVHMLYILQKRTGLDKSRFSSSLAFWYNYLLLILIVLYKPQVAFFKLPEYSEAYNFMQTYDYYMQFQKISLLLVYYF